MGIYIQDMEMPKDGQMLVIFPDGTAYVCFNGMRERLAQAEAVSVQPHGRCVDADALLRVIHDAYEARDAEQNAIMDKVSMLVVAAPTIIPADPAEERA